MFHTETLGLFVGAVMLGAVHGLEPGHGWPIAATYALDQANKWVYGFAASFILGVGHLISSIAMVLAFFWAKDYLGLTDVGWMGYVAGALLILLGLREYRLYRTGGHHLHSELGRQQDLHAAHAAIHRRLVRDRRGRPQQSGR